MVRRVIRQHRREIKYCYEKEVAKKPDLAGRLTVRFEIDERGKVESAKISKTTLKNKSVETCVVNRVKRWRFPRPEDGGKVVVTYPFEFSSQ